MEGDDRSEEMIIDVSDDNESEESEEEIQEIEEDLDEDI
jgi:hypothetical protein